MIICNLEEVQIAKNMTKLLNVLIHIVFLKIKLKIKTLMYIGAIYIIKSKHQTIKFVNSIPFVFLRMRALIYGNICFKVNSPIKSSSVNGRQIDDLQCPDAYFRFFQMRLS